jgi:hypothetical protein
MMSDPKGVRMLQAFILSVIFSIPMSQVKGNELAQALAQRPTQVSEIPVNLKVLELIKQKLIEKGTDEDGPYGVAKVLKVVFPENNQESRNASYFVGLGGYDQNQVYSIGGFNAVEEEWTKLPEGGFKLEIWTFQVTLVGQITNFTHGTMSYNNLGNVVDFQYPATSIDEIEAKWRQIEREWSKRFEYNFK